MGISGVKALPFSFPATHLTGKSEEWLGQYIERQARTMIDRYGDARNPRPEVLITEAEQQVYQEMNS